MFYPVRKFSELFVIQKLDPLKASKSPWRENDRELLSRDDSPLNSTADIAVTVWKY